MNIVILAAGLGSRLDRSCKLPKALTLLANGQSILQFQIQQLSVYLEQVPITVVVGYQFDKIIAAFPEVQFFYNPEYALENTAGSLRRALKKMQGDVLFLNGDVVFHPYAIKTILNYGSTSMVVNDSIVHDEEIKYRTNDQGFILEVSKKVQEPQGEAIGINFIKNSDLACFTYFLERCDKKDYFEKALELAIQGGMEVKALPIMPNFGLEIDFKEDLERANFMIASWDTDSFIAR